MKVSTFIELLRKVHSKDTYLLIDGRLVSDVEKYNSVVRLNTSYFFDDAINVRNVVSKLFNIDSLYSNIQVCRESKISYIRDIREFGNYINLIV